MRNVFSSRQILTGMACLTGLFLCSVNLQAADPPHVVRCETLYPRIELVTWYSQQLQKEKQFCVVFPQAFPTSDSSPPAADLTAPDQARNADRAINPQDVWPVLYFLHGRGRHERSLVDDPQTRDQLLRANFVIVLPDGDDSWYIDSPVRTVDKYESYLTELMDLTRQTWSLSPRPADRAIGGWSMGGYGAMHYLVSHPREFSAVVTLIGLVDFPRDGLPAGQSYDVPATRFGEEQSAWPAWNPITHVEKLGPHSVFLLTAHEAFDRTMNENFSGRLNELEIAHQLEILEGGHTFDVVRAGVSRMIPHLNAHLAQDQSRAPE